ncbi:ATP-dependent Clp protease ATP-binding subunit [Bengtsoniella intestinalis]|uniref:ATP-dependent Clp protease ATP-binding subunit n=1 Tax=Bengtsoniella intestinalis TaxID=3073143 RepID=UPI00391FB3FF
MGEVYFTKQAEQALALSQSAAEALGHDYVGTEHLLLGLYRQRYGVAAQVLMSQGAEEANLTAGVISCVGSGMKEGWPLQGLTPRAQRVVELGWEITHANGGDLVDTEHLLCGILRQGNNRAMEVLAIAGMEDKVLYSQLMQRILCARGLGNHASDTNRTATPKEDSIAKYKLLREFARDLTAMAKAGKLDPVIGRDREIQRTIQILSRRSKNNPCLIGEPGVGKTAVAEGLARRLAMGDVPQILMGYKLLSVDLSAMVAGTKYRGEFEERIKKLLEEVRKAGDVLLFIDEVHTIVGAGSAEGAVDAANILKPALSRGELRVIGATTLNEYRTHIEKDAALERRFQPITVEEPSNQTALEILQGLKPRYEAHHNLTIAPEAVSAAVSLSVRYIHGRFLPDKAIDLMDEAAAAVTMGRVKCDALAPLEEKLWALEREKTMAIDNQDYETAAKLRTVEENYLLQLQHLRRTQHQMQHQRPTVTAEDVAKVVAGWTGVPVQQLSQSETERLQQLEQTLHTQVVGQDEAVRAVAKALRRSRMGLKDPRRPIGSFLFLGPTGVGKTQLCRGLAHTMFGAEEAMIRLDMSEYGEAHSLSRLIGSPPGYVGHEDGGQLTERVRRRPYAVVLFDEIEKAHHDIWNLLLQLLEEGTLTDSQGRRVDFKNTVVVMTSNLGAGEILSAGHCFGFAGNEDDPEKVFARTKEQVTEQLQRTFRPEFLNRIDQTIVFRQLRPQDLQPIAKGMLQSTVERMKCLSLGLEITEQAVALLCKKGYNAKYGARPLRRCIQSEVEDVVAELMLSGQLQTGDVARLDAEGDLLKIAKTP